MNSFLVCKYGGMITPVTSGQHNNPISPDDFYSISDYFDIRSHGANNNPPTGAGDAGFTFNNEFNALSAVSVLCGSKFVQYKPFQDEPEEDAFSVGELAFKTVLGLAAVGGLAIYAASLVMVRRHRLRRMCSPVWLRSAEGQRCSVWQKRTMHVRM